MYRENPEMLMGSSAGEITSRHVTPYYHYDLNCLKSTLNELKYQLKKHNIRAHYSVKANANPFLLKMIRESGLGADCVSGNEIERAIQCGFKEQDIVYAGVGKREDEIRLALKKGIFCMNCESLAELQVVNALAGSMGKRAHVAIRVNPNIDSHTHRYITTGAAYNKFGLGDEELNAAIDSYKQWEHLEITGLHMHVGSQITDKGVFRRLCRRMNDIQLFLNEKGLYFQHLNLGGGLAIHYEEPDVMSDFSGYLDMIRQHLHVFPDQTVHVEPGRSVTGQCGSLITKVLYVKKSFGKQFVIVDAGFTDLIRPALYQAYHKIENLSSNGPLKKYDVVGPICESSDCFGQDVELPECSEGDMLAIQSAGAYGEVMASRYNLRELPGSICAWEKPNQIISEIPDRKKQVFAVS
ncbi:MAG: diaminopimelate decarboxylase [Bacteroidota bacterium]